MKEIFTDNSFYYFYSTVPQVLAGGIALLGAFLIFFITESNKKMLKILKDTWNYIENLSEPDYLKVTNDLRKHFTIMGLAFSFDKNEIEYIEKKFYNKIFALIEKGSDGKDYVINRNCEQFKLEFNFKSNVVKGGIRAVVLSGILMAFCIFILPFVQGLIKFLPLGIFITVLIIGFSFYAIYLIAYVVIRAIQKL